jgi:hypothetical protein
LQLAVQVVLLFLVLMHLSCVFLFFLDDDDDGDDGGGGGWEVECTTANAARHTMTSTS